MRNLVLFTRDLRTHDHPALTAAVEGGAEVLPLFVLDLGLPVGRLSISTRSLRRHGA